MADMIQGNTVLACQGCGHEARYNFANFPTDGLAEGLDKYALFLEWTINDANYEHQGCPWAADVLMRDITSELNA